MQLEECCDNNLLDIQQMEKNILLIIKSNHLLKDIHPFFISAQKYNVPNNSLSLPAAFNIARQWEHMTKVFMFTTLASIAKLSQQLAKTASFSPTVLSTLQTGLQVISDDFLNNNQAFTHTAPKGPYGIHYKWWQDEIVRPIANKLDINSWSDLPINKHISELITGMHTLAEHPFGFAIQLRLVEAIALEIAVSFRDIYANITFENEKVFPHRTQLSWITSHIKAEINHHTSVCDLNIGMSCLASTAQEQQLFLKLMNWYASLWSNALNDFNQFLQCN